MNKGRFGEIFILALILIILFLTCVAFAAGIPQIVTPPNSLNSGALGQKYEFQLLAENGEGQLTWAEVTPQQADTVNLNSLGLFLSSDGLIYGTLKTTGTVPDVQIKSFTVKVTDSASTPQVASRTFALTIYKDAAIRKTAIDGNCFLEVADLDKDKGKWLPGDLTSNISVGPMVSTQLFRYNLATEKASFNALGLGIGAAFRFYNDNDMKAHPQTNTKSIRNIKPNCRATTFSNFDSVEYPAHSWLSISPMLFAAVPENTSGDAGKLNLQPAIVVGFLQDLINIGLGFNLAGQNQGEVFLLMGLGTGFKF